jgi:hypothetical protein
MIQKFGERSGCDPLSMRQVSGVAKDAGSGKLNVEDFKKAYESSCSYRESLIAAESPRRSEFFAELLENTKQRGRCLQLSSRQALKVAQFAEKGELRAHDFEIAYHSSCNFDGSLAAVRMLVIGSISEGSQARDRIASARESRAYRKSRSERAAAPAGVSAYFSEAGSGRVRLAN